MTTSISGNSKRQPQQIQSQKKSLQMKTDELVICPGFTECSIKCLHGIPHKKTSLCDIKCYQTINKKSNSGCIPYPSLIKLSSETISKIYSKDIKPETRYTLKQIKEAWDNTSMECWPDYVETLESISNK